MFLLYSCLPINCDTFYCLIHNLCPVFYMHIKYNIKFTFAIQSSTLADIMDSHIDNIYYFKLLLAIVLPSTSSDIVVFTSDKSHSDCIYRLWTSEYSVSSDLFLYSGLLSWANWIYGCIWRLCMVQKYELFFINGLFLAWIRKLSNWIF